MSTLPEMPLMGMLRERMSWLNRRQDLLSQNVANADTPGYVARDLKPLNFEDALKTPSLAVTNARHIAISPTHASVGEEEAADVNPARTAMPCRWSRK